MEIFLLFISPFYFTAYGSYGGSHNLRLLILIMRLFMLSVTSLACFDLVTSPKDLNFLWYDPCQWVQNVQAKQTLLPGVLSCCIYHTQRIH